MKKWAPLLWIPMLALAAWVLADRLESIDFHDVKQQVLAQPLGTMLLGLLFSTGVYALVGIYEGIAVRMASGRKMFGIAFRTAIISNPIGRAIGLALVSGGALRYRMYATVGLSAREVAAVVVLAAMPYFFSVGWLIDLSLLLNAETAAKALRLSTDTVLLLGALGLTKDLAWLTFVIRRKTPLIIGGQTLPVPTFRDTSLQLIIGLVQISLMTGILYLFMPEELNMSWPAFIAIYCIAFVAGQLSNVPAGLGVLEAALLLMLPQVPPAKLLGAVLAYRAVFEILPLLVALGLLLTFESTSASGFVRRRLLRR
ncbi:lysylphosphatidylglycerol synthase transmembrane domain-containing protein [Peristeroidobacter soli]|uniref:lysylphosphatidylglycerol synthase transmembrane domain-containing protein n=1 Tax=Peristeroidobacter soli TaxID=2497877 RepID=UPI00101DF05A|nr:YbhN family protein [Peristeroidobacter soli]